MLNDHVIPMFRITRAELVAGMEAKLASLAEARATVEKVLAEARMEQQRQALGEALKELDENTDRARFLRDHAAPFDHWDVSAQQAVEIWRSFELVKVSESELRLALEPKKTITRVAHNFNGRSLRT